MPLRGGILVDWLLCQSLLSAIVHGSDGHGGAGPFSFGDGRLAVRRDPVGVGRGERLVTHGPPR